MSNIEWWQDCPKGTIFALCHVLTLPFHAHTNKSSPNLIFLLFTGTPQDFSNDHKPRCIKGIFYRGIKITSLSCHGTEIATLYCERCYFFIAAKLSIVIGVHLWSPRSSSPFPVGRPACRTICYWLKVPKSPRKPWMLGFKAVTAVLPGLSFKCLWAKFVSIVCWQIYPEALGLNAFSQKKSAIILH